MRRCMQELRPPGDQADEQLNRQLSPMHGASGPATSPVTAEEKEKEEEEKTSSVLLGLDKVVDVSVIINDKFQLFLFQL